MLALICLFPIISFLILALFGPFLSRRVAATIGCGSVALSGLVTLWLLPSIGAEGLRENWGAWISHAGALSPEFRFHLDALSGTMVGIVCFVGFLIHLYSTEYMHHEEGHNRFFAYMNLFIGAMLILLLADDMLLLFLGWEGVGLCSYLLIGFLYKDPYNIRCAQKAIYLTRIGDVAFMVALFILFVAFESWNIPTVHQAASTQWPVGSTLATVVAALMLIAAVGKSAQIPLHVWLPDAMAGPTPVSALLHSSTMVTAGVYLVARLHNLFLLSPEMLHLVAICGAVTALYAGITAIGQTDIKRILAYSTISQIGYMFLALGVGAFGAGIFHFFTHAFFKALLFLGAGAVIHAIGGEQDIRKMGGLRKKLPLTFWTFVAGSAALAALPLITSGFYSKDAILWGAYSGGYQVLWIVGVVTALLTGWYTARLVLYTFFGRPYPDKVHAPGWAISLPLCLLAVGSLVAGFLETPLSLGGIHLWQSWISPVFATGGEHAAHGTISEEVMTQSIAAVAGLSGILIAYFVVFKRRDALDRWRQKAWGAIVNGISTTGFYVDQIYLRVFEGGFERLTDLLRREWIDSFINSCLVFVNGSYQVARATQSGRVRWYAIGLVVGAIALGAGVLWL